MDVETVEIGQLDVEDHEVRAEALDLGQRAASVVRLRDLEPLVAQRGGNELGDRLLVIDDEDASSFPQPVLHPSSLTIRPERFLSSHWVILGYALWRRPVEAATRGPSEGLVELLSSWYIPAARGGAVPDSGGGIRDGHRHTVLSASVGVRRAARIAG